ncbi:MAG TPA: PRC-barrel domain-containing protein [Thermoanaerobaculia bacterium]|nr:PRC-barrel domain-containing protein [Thermoanaerobaculia bacterium]
MTTTQTRPQQVLSASTLIGGDVQNSQGENLGSIKELMLDVDLGRVAYAVLSFGGFLGMGDKLFAIPFGALRLNAEKEHFTLDVPKERLKDAPGFDKDDWPSAADRTWGREIHTFYGVEPYWGV